MNNLEKADDKLRQILSQGKLRVLLTLSGETSDEEPPPSDEEPSPSDFPTRTDWRKVMIERQKKRLERALSETIRSLEEIGIWVIAGGDVIPIILVEGTAEQITLALALPGVKRATLDQPVMLGDWLP